MQSNSRALFIAGGLTSEGFQHQLLNSNYFKPGAFVVDCAVNTFYTVILLSAYIKTTDQ